MRKFFWLVVLTTVIALITASPAFAPLGGSRPSHVAANTTLQKLWSPATTQQIWSNGGSLILPLAAQVMASRNPPGQPLTTQQKKYLRPAFGDLVDRVQVNYNAKLADRWSNGTQEVHIGAVDSSAQAYCDRIYLRAAYKPQDTAQLVLLAHELTHFQQCKRLGGIQNFGYQYFQAYQQAQQRYADNQFEKEARAGEQKFINILCQQINCENPSGKYYVNYQGVDVKLPVSLK